MRLHGSSTPPDPTVALEPDLIFSEDWPLEPYGLAGQVLHTPGHTPGSVSVVLEDGDFIAGDLLRGQVLRPRRPAPPFVAYNLAENWKSLRRLLALGPKIIHVTH